MLLLRCLRATVPTTPAGPADLTRRTPKCLELGHLGVPRDAPDRSAPRSDGTPLPLQGGRNDSRPAAKDMGLKWGDFNAMTVADKGERATRGKIDECGGLAYRNRKNRD